MMTITIRLQSVLYDNDKAAIRKAVLSMSNAADCYRAKGHSLECILSYGDASDSPLYSDKEILDLKAECPGLTDIRYTFFHENTGTARGHNLLAADCSADYILLMNPDIILCPDFFEEILRPFTAPSCGAAEGRQVPVEHPKDYDRHSFETAWTSGACTFIRTDVFRKVGGYDDKNFYMYCDDVDLSLRVRLAGFKLIYCPRAMVLHSKTPGPNGMSVPSSVEKYGSSLANLILSVKYAHPEKTKQFLELYSASPDPELRKAAEDFLKMKEEGRLPQPIDPEHAVSVYCGDSYAVHRFIL